MLIKPMKAPLPNAISLFILMVFALSTMGMASAEELAEEAYRNSQALVTVNAVHVLATVHERYLRLNSDVKTSDRSNSGGVRRLASSVAGLEGISASLLQRVSTITSTSSKIASKIASKIVSTIQVLWWRLLQKSSEDVFKSLKLNEKGMKLLESPKFPTYKAFVMATNSKEEAMEKIFKATVKEFGSELALAKYLGQVKSSHKLWDTVQPLRDYLVQRWDENGKSVEDIYHLLGIEKVESDKIPGSPEFTMWGAFVFNKHVSNAHDVKFLYEAGNLLGPHEELPLIRGLADTIAADKDADFARRMLYGRFQYLLTEERYTPDYTFKDWKLNEADDPLKIPLGRAWVDYMYLRSMVKDGGYDANNFRGQLALVMGEEKALLAMKMVQEKGHFLRPLNRKSSLV